jgi:cytohesin
MKSQLIAIVAALLVVGCGPSASDISIHDAAAGGHIKAIKQHLAAGADVSAKDRYGATPLHRAATTEIAELLIAKGADVNAKGKGGQTPLHYAAGEGHMEIVELLIAKGADVNAAIKNGHTALNYTKLHPETAELLRKHGGKMGKQLRAADTNRKISKPQANRALLEAAKDGNIHTAIAAVKQAITDGANVNAKDAGWADMTALHYAAQKGHKEIIELLIANSVNVNAKNLTDKTPLDWANTFNRTEIADLLRKHGAKTAEELKAEGK